MGKHCPNFFDSCLYKNNKQQQNRNPKNPRLNENKVQQRHEKKRSSAWRNFLQEVYRKNPSENCARNCLRFATQRGREREEGEEGKRVREIYARIEKNCKMRHRQRSVVLPLCSRQRVGGQRHFYYAILSAACIPCKV